MADISTQYLDQPLNDISVGYVNDDFFGMRLFPPVPVKKQSGRYWVFGKEKFRQYETIRHARAEARQIAPWSLSNGLYFCDDHSLKDVISDEELSNEDSTDTEVNTVTNLNDAILLDFELRARAAILNNASSLSFNTALGTGTQWSDFVNSDPVVAVMQQKAVIKKNIAKPPNTLAVSYPIHLQLLEHPRIIDRFKHTEAGVMNPGHMAKVFEVENYWVMGAESDTATEGQPPTLNFIWGDSQTLSTNPQVPLAILAYVPPSPQKRDPAFGYTFRWLFGEPDLQGVLTKRYRVESVMGDVIEVHRYDDIEIVTPQAAGLWTSVIA